jgi:GrpB-like predicted nucleotidyltransferase (UPF0157 family)
VRGSPDEVLIGGREPIAIVIRDYDASWPVRFETERARIAGVLGELARSIEHIGSTAVPGLAAKPIVDILVAVAAVEPDDTFRAGLEEAGYLLRVREPGHRMFRTPARDVHVHVWAEDDEAVSRHLLFRDQLRRDAGDRAAYEQHKRRLAARRWADMNEYAEAKSDLIASIVERARHGAALVRDEPRPRASR